MKGQIAQKVRDIFQSFNINPKDIFLEEEEVKMEIEGKLADGTIIYSSATEWAASADVYTKDETGNAVPVPAGDYTLDDGRMVVIGDDSKIVEIKEAEMEVEDEVEEEMSSADLLKTIESLGARISALENEKSEMLNQMSEVKVEALSKEIELSAVKHELQTIKQSPAVDSIKSKRSEVALSRDNKETKEKTYSAMTVQERVNQYLSKIK
jgi:arsenate reductase-like glutaredoxin family protein